MNMFRLIWLTCIRGSKRAASPWPEFTLSLRRIPTRTSDVLPGIQSVLAKSDPLPFCVQHGLTASRCQVIEGDYCDKIVNDVGLTTDDFYFLNQALDKTCSNLQLGTAYCIKPVGDIKTYPGYEVEGPSTSFTRPPSSTISVTLPTVTLHPHAPGTLDSCETYVNAVDTPAMEFRILRVESRGG